MVAAVVVGAKVYRLAAECAAGVDKLLNFLDRHGDKRIDLSG